jgi:HK97 family phage major capsid protein
LQTDGGASGGSLTVPTTVEATVYAFITNSVAIRRIARIIPTSAGNPMAFPRVATHSIATQIASQTTTLAGSDTVLGSMTLNAYDYAELVAVSNDMLDDSGVDVLTLVAEQVGRALGQVIDNAYVTGNGTTGPQGIQGAGAVGGAGTIATGGSLILGPGGNSDPNSLIDLQYSIADGYNGRLAWLFNRKTVASLRKMRDGGGGTIGAFLWQPSYQYGLVPGQPDRFLGDPVYSDPYVASMASDAKIGFYGDWTAFYVRDVGTFRLERSDDIYFDKNQVAFRGIWRTDSDLIDGTAINTLHQAVT